MTRPYDNVCPTCGSMMSYIRRRGSSSGTWFCPACRAVFGPRREQQGDENQHDDPRNPRGGMGRAA